MTDTNIKGLPDGMYFTEIGYSQSYPWVEIKRTAHTITLAKVLVDTDPEWIAKREFIPGGFVGHCPNQHEQTWLFSKVDHEHTRVIRKTKIGWSRHGVKYVEGRAREFYDYNF